MFALVKALKTAAHDPRIKAVLMQFEAPALSMAATMEASKRRLLFLVDAIFFCFFWSFEIVHARRTESHIFQM